MAEFLTAEWRKLVVLNYEVERDILIPHLPAGVDLDYFEEKLYVSLVGFLFKNTRVKGFIIPGHSTFEEVNLRFYVKRKVSEEETRRGVVFIKEIVPKKMIAAVANTLYKEHYVTKKMRHKIQRNKDLNVSYSWLHDKKWNQVSVKAKSVAKKAIEGSKAHFITDHFWGYTRKNEYATSEYEVGHPTWRMYEVFDHNIRIDFGANYGREFEFLNKATPESVMLAEGSEIFVNDGQVIN